MLAHVAHRCYHRKNDLFKNGYDIQFMKCLSIVDSFSQNTNKEIANKNFNFCDYQYMKTYYFNKCEIDIPQGSSFMKGFFIRNQNIKYLKILKMESKNELKVIGAGFGRTGTTSLAKALEILGVGPCYHLNEIIDRPDKEVEVCTF